MGSGATIPRKGRKWLRAPDKALVDAMVDCKMSMGTAREDTRRWFEDTRLFWGWRHQTRLA